MNIDEIKGKIAKIDKQLADSSLSEFHENFRAKKAKLQDELAAMEKPKETDSPKIKKDKEQKAKNVSMFTDEQCSELAARVEELELELESYTGGKKAKKDKAKSSKPKPSFSKGLETTLGNVVKKVAKKATKDLGKNPKVEAIEKKIESVKSAKEKFVQGIEGLKEIASGIDGSMFKGLAKVFDEYVSDLQKQIDKLNKTKP